tara:strand:+ start:31067 stop:32257 length:1191 start_codon:yes stop_codon:yes gene_type:complete
MKIFQLPDIAQYYPKPKVPMLPVFNPNELSLQQQPKPFSRFLQSDVLYLPSGRVALYYALQLLNIDSQSEVLIPAYHCGSMVEPVIYLGATPRLFHLNAKLQVQTEELETHITPHTKALLLPHFFGFPQDLVSIKAFCDKHQIALIEDCAHCFFSQAHADGIGSIGDFSITSTVKFFPGVEGGALACNNPNYDLTSIQRTAPSIPVQLKSLLHTLELSAGYNRLGALGKLLNSRNGKAYLTEIPAGIATDTCITRTLTEDSLQWFTPAQIGKDATVGTRLFTRHSDMQSIIDKRRNNFQRYLDAFKTTASIKPLHQQLPDRVVPYIFPLLLEDPQHHFSRLKLAGVPIWRWEELVTSDGPVSTDYRLSLIQLPCHQSLKDEEIEWIINTIQATVDS